MMVNSNVPRYSNLASEQHRKYLFKFNCSNFSVFSSIKHAHDGSVVRTDYKLVQFQLQQLYGEIVQLQSALNDDYNNVQEKSNIYHISEPIIKRFFSKTCAILFTGFRAGFIVSFSFCNETLQHFAKFWRLFRSVM